MFNTSSLSPRVMNFLNSIGQAEAEDASSALAIQLLGYTGKENNLPIAASDRAKHWAEGDLLDIVREWAAGFVPYSKACDLAGGRARARAFQTIGNRRRWAEFIGMPAMECSQSDFGSVLLNALAKTVSANYLQFPASWRRYCQQVQAVRFDQSAAIFEPVGFLTESAEGGGALAVLAPDTGFTWKIKAYRGFIDLTWEATVAAESAVAFGEIPRIFSGNAISLEDKLVAAELIANRTLEDGKAVFHTDRGNLLSGGSSALSATSLGTAIDALAAQTTPGGTDSLRLKPRYLVVPSKLVGTADVLLKSMDYSTLRPEERIERIHEPFLDDDSGTAWYLACDWRQHPTIQVAMIQGYEEATISVIPQPNPDKTRYQCRHCVASRIVSPLGLVKSAGA